MEVMVLTGCFIFISLVGYLFAGSVDKFLNHVYLPNFHQLFS